MNASLRDEAIARIALEIASGFFRPRARREIARFGSASAAARLLRLPLGEAEAVLARAETSGLRALVPGAPDFPAALAAIPDPPLLLWLRGALPAAPALAIVGARRASARALACAHEFARDVARAGVVVVSGLAYGVDAAAHEGALAGGFATVAVLASGVDVVTPKGQTKLAQRILDGGGGWVSERPPGSDAHARHFPERNRLISGLASATLVIEAREKSGSLWTARHALEQGRDVLVVPGPIDSDLCRGTNRLLRDGATPVLEAADALAAVLGPLAPPRPAGSSPNAAAPAGPDAALLALLADGPCDADDLGAALGVPAAGLARRLVELELLGRVRREGTRVILCR